MQFNYWTLIFQDGFSCGSFSRVEKEHRHPISHPPGVFDASAFVALPRECRDPQLLDHTAANTGVLTKSKSYIDRVSLCSKPQKHVRRILIEG